MEDKLQKNIEIHNKIAGQYQSIHPEIFNEIEQNRLHDELRSAIKVIESQSSSSEITAMDYGCGSGNLTAHLLDMGLKVISADVSVEFVNLIKKQFGNNDKSSTFLLNGKDLSEISDNSIDFVGVYSVLHHIPDYLAALRDIARVIKPGGVLYIDHENSPDFWINYKEITEFTSQYTKYTLKKKLLCLLNPKWYIRKYKKIRNPKWQAEGDIHVWQDDHIEWDKIEALLSSKDFELQYYKDFFHYTSQYDLQKWKEISKKYNDFRTGVFRKKSS